MSIDFQILGSSSSGNCSILQTSESKILIDAGFSGKKIIEFLENINLSPEDIDAVFITHEHSDHATGLRGLSKFSHIQYFANQDTAQALQKQLSRPVNWQIFETGSTFSYKTLEVTAFSIPHDAYDPVGYVFRCPEEGNYGEFQSLAWVTDLGYIPQLVQEKIRHTDILVLECNYDTELLDADERRPWSVKQRIKSRHGHLSNEDTYNFLADTPSPLWKKVYLAHLSKDCNDIQRVEALFAPLMHPTTPFHLEIIDPSSSPTTTPAFV